MGAGGPTDPLAHPEEHGEVDTGYPAVENTGGRKCGTGGNPVGPLGGGLFKLVGVSFIKREISMHVSEIKTGLQVHASIIANVLEVQVMQATSGLASKSSDGASSAGYIPVAAGAENTILVPARIQVKPWKSFVWRTTVKIKHLTILQRMETQVETHTRY